MCRIAITLSVGLYGAALIAGEAQAQLIDPNQNCVYQPGSTRCEPIRRPTAPQPSGAPFDQFVSIVSNSGMSLRDHPTYTPDYFGQQARLYCDLLARGEMMKINQAVSFPPIVHITETPRDRPRLEVAILRVAAINFCPNYFAQEQQWEGTFVR
jgi:hypothetical protein